MTVRSATLDDLAVLEELWRAFEAEVPPPAHEEVDVATELAEIRAIVESGLGWLAERDGVAVGMALARRRGPRVGRITDLYVTPSARRGGVAEALTRAVAARFLADGVDTVDLEVMASNTAARAAYARWGFRDEVLVLAAPVAALAERLGETVTPDSFGSIHAQTDDVDVILKAVEMYVPRLPGRSTGSIVTQPRGGYVTVYDDVCDRDPAMLRRLAKEISSQDRARRDRGRGRGGGGRPDDPVRSRRDRRRVRVGARVPRAAAAGRGRRAAREPGRDRALHRCLAGVRPGRHPGGRCPGRPAARARAAGRPRRRPRPLGCRARLGRRARGRRRDPGSTAEAAPDRRAPLPVLRPRPDRARREGRPVRDGRDRPRRPSRLALRAEPRRPGAGARRGRLGAAGVGRDQRVPRGAVPRAAAPPGRIPARGRRRASRSSATTTSRAPTTPSGAGRRERRPRSPTRSRPSTRRSRGRPS